MQITTEAAGLTPLNGCRACGQDFTAVETFDQHRVGFWDQRRCLDAEEMEAKGWSLDERGRWVNAAKAKRTSEAFSEAAVRA